MFPVDAYRIKRAREEAGMSVIDLASTVGMDRSMLYRLEAGEVRRSGKLKALYRTLGLDSSLMNRQDPDAEALLDAFYELKRSSPAKAAQHLHAISEDAAHARALREELERLEERRLAFERGNVVPIDPNGEEH